MNILKSLKERLLFSWKAKVLLIATVLADAVILAAIIGIWSDVKFFIVVEVIAIIEILIILVFRKFFFGKAISIMYNDTNEEA